MNSVMRKVIRDERGAAMMLAVILLLVAGLVVASLLSFMGTGFLVGPVYEGRVAELYGADAGVEIAVWKIQHRTDIPTGCAGDITRSYNATDVNGRRVEFSVTRANNVTLMYKILSIATSDDGSTTAVEADVETMVFDLLSGALVSSGDIVLHKGCTVAGDVYYVGEITGDYEHIDGDEIRIPSSVFPTQEQNKAFADQFRAQALAGGTYDENNGNMDVSESQELGPIYIPGNLNINRAVTINLKGVVYVKGYIRCDNTLTITGTGSLVAEGYVYLSKLANYDVTGDSIIMSLNSDITLKKSDPTDELSVGAFIYAPNGTIWFDKDMTVTGSVIGAGIEIDKEGSFTYVSKASSFGFPIWVPYGAQIKTYNIIQN